MNEQKIIIIEIEEKPERAGTIYSSAADAEHRINEQLQQGWRLSSVTPLSGSAARVTSVCTFERVSKK